MQALLSRIAAGASLSGSSGSKELHLPDLAAHDMSIDKEWHKTKTIYAGSYRSSSSSSSQATEIKVSVNQRWPCRGL
jgi:hypothetical protein